MHLKIRHISTTLAASLMLVVMSNQSVQSQNTIPKAFMIGEYEAVYGEVAGECNTSLLAVCDDYMDVAYEKWIKMLTEMEGYADSIGFDIKGVKVWLNIFWNNDGTIKHLVYYPKPNSRNMDFQLLTAFYINFANQYQLDQAHQSCYSHYGSASFPIYSQLYRSQEK